MKKCPHCDPHRSKLVIEEHMYGWVLLCQACGATGPVTTSMLEAEQRFLNPESSAKLTAI